MINLKSPRTASTISACVYCSSSESSAGWHEEAEQLGAMLASENMRLVYGGGGRGLMGACARAALSAGGAVVGILPNFLLDIERSVPGIELVIVDTMQERKTRMFQESDVFIVLPGGIGTLEEIVELLSLRKMQLHKKPIIFYNPANFWDNLLNLFEDFSDRDLVPPWFNGCWQTVTEMRGMHAVIQAIKMQQQIEISQPVGLDS